MRIISEPLQGLKLIEFNIFNDERGCFAERYSQGKFAQIGVNNIFVQDNFSHSSANVIRGLHYQKSPDQAKLVGVTSGKILDVAVDIRKESPTFGQHFAVELTAENGLMLFISAGFAHGFCAITAADVMYKVDGAYNAKGEGGLAYNDAKLGIKWPAASPIVSVKDAALQSWQEYAKNPVF